ncbi:septal ring lytic transglycosylase RlpA family protein [Nonomuraea sp. G32]|nr:septal ring lytic transglycosylase RlpA family protein [Nonomuraea sp. G32]MDP4508902.1 septal ring lytic transglycosylase RlpA family protein [Nonomuraea sp. G32]
MHSHKPSPTGRRRWSAIVVGTAVLATASSAAWATLANDDLPKHTAAPAAAAQGSAPSTGPAAANEAARQSAPKTPSPAPKPPSAALPNPTKPAEQSVKPTDQSAKPTEASAKPSQQPVKAKTEAAKPKVRVLSSGSCGASFYDEPQMTASGERFNPSAMTAAHKTLPLGSKVRVTNPNTGESVTVRINDRGPYIGGRCLDLSAAAFSAIGNTGAGVMRVRYEVLAR